MLYKRAQTNISVGSVSPPVSSSSGHYREASLDDVDSPALTSAAAQTASNMDELLADSGDRPIVRKGLENRPKMISGHWYEDPPDRGDVQSPQPTV